MCRCTASLTIPKPGLFSQGHPCPPRHCPPMKLLEAARLHSLHDLQVLDTEPETQFDAMVKVPSLVCGVPISQISA
jgi:hypothetical protein